MAVGGRVYQWSGGGHTQASGLGSGKRRPTGAPAGDNTEAGGPGGGACRLLHTDAAADQAAARAGLKQAEWAWLEAGSSTICPMSGDWLCAWCGHHATPWGAEAGERRKACPP